MDAETAWSWYPRIELPPSNSHVAVVVDIDHAWDGEPDILPSWSVTAFPSRKSHLVYALENPVHDNPKSLAGPLHKLADVADRLTLHLGGDVGYGGRITRNPLNPGPDCDSHFYGMFPYSLDALDRALPKIKRSRKLERFSGIGRNCDTFAWAVS